MSVQDSSKRNTAVVVKRLEIALLVCGSLLMATFIAGSIDRSFSVRAEIAGFQKASAKPVSTASDQRHTAVDFSYWSENRISAYLKTLAAKLPAPLALLRISKVNLDVPVLEGTGAVVLNRGVGHIVGTAYPGESGNVGIAGHRDSFFRVLQHVGVGDVVELETSTRVFHYQVRRITVVDPADLTVLRPQPNPSLTLITCYPFHFLGSAPKRYVIEAGMTDVFSDSSVKHTTPNGSVKSLRCCLRSTRAEAKLQTVNERSSKETRQ